MPTRAAAKRELASLSNPAAANTKSTDQNPVKSSSTFGSKKSASAKHKKPPESMNGHLDILPDGQGGVMKSENDDFVDIKTAKRKRAVSNNKAVDTSKEVVNKASKLITASGKGKRKETKGRAHKYGLTPGRSPFPDHVMPTPEACEEVNRLLSKLHGEVKQPDVIPPPSLAVTGCGEVPDALDAILRTYLSSNTSANNSNLAMQGLIKTFGLRTSGPGKGSINWEAVLAADTIAIEKAIKSGGMASRKSKSIKKLLEIVHAENVARRDALVQERKTGKEAAITGAQYETKAAKDTEIMKADDNLLSMDHIFEMTTEDAMEEMIKLPGIAVKTSSCVILFCMKRPSFAVDTHVLRHCKMLGWVPSSATADKTFSHCEVRVPSHLKYSLHHLFFKHGRTCGRCTAKGSWEAYNNTICPIEHLVDRSILAPKKQPKKRKREANNDKESGEDDSSDISD